MTQNINGIFQQTESNRYANFYSSNFDYPNGQCSHPQRKVDNDELKLTFETDPFQSACEISLCVVSSKTVLTNLDQIGKIKVWVSGFHMNSTKVSNSKVRIMLLSIYKSV